MNPERRPSWKKARRRTSDSPLLSPHYWGRGGYWGRGAGGLSGGRPSFPNTRRVLAATRHRTARELWDLISPTSAETAFEVCVAVSGSKVFVKNLALARPPSRARWKKALRMTSVGPVIALMYLFYLLVALAITLPVLAVVFLADLPAAVKSFFRRRRRPRPRRRGKRR